MIDLKDMQLLVALARHNNFSLAAEDCSISQPAFSARLRKMEEQTGLAIVRRGNRFIGFTSEGDLILNWAQKILSDVQTMEQDLQMLQGGLRGRLVLGSVPTAVPFAATVASAVRREHADLTIEVQTLSSRQITDGLASYALDAAITYTENPDPTVAIVTELYEESYVLLAPVGMAPRKSGTASWAEAAEMPLSLLSTSMRNRRFIDEAFATAGAVAKPVMETNGFTASLTQVSTGTAATIAPEGWATTIPLGDTVVKLGLRNPTLTHSIGLVSRPQETIPPAIDALHRSALASL